MAQVGSHQWARKPTKKRSSSSSRSTRRMAPGQYGPDGKLVDNPRYIESPGPYRDQPTGDDGRNTTSGHITNRTSGEVYNWKGGGGGKSTIEIATEQAKASTYLAEQARKAQLIAQRQQTESTRQKARNALKRLRNHEKNTSAALLDKMHNRVAYNKYIAKKRAAKDKSKVIAAGLKEAVIEYAKVNNIKDVGQLFKQITSGEGSEKYLSKEDFDVMLNPEKYYSQDAQVDLDETYKPIPINLLRRNKDGSPLEVTEAPSDPTNSIRFDFNATIDPDVLWGGVTDDTQYYDTKTMQKYTPKTTAYVPPKTPDKSKIKEFLDSYEESKNKYLADPADYGMTFDYPVKPNLTQSTTPYTDALGYTIAIDPAKIRTWQEENLKKIFNNVNITQIGENIRNNPEKWFGPSPEELQLYRSTETNKQRLDRLLGKGQQIWDGFVDPSGVTGGMISKVPTKQELKDYVKARLKGINIANKSPEEAQLMLKVAEGGQLSQSEADKIWLNPQLKAELVESGHLDKKWAYMTQDEADKLVLSYIFSKPGMQQQATYMAGMMGLGYALKGVPFGGKVPDVADWSLAVPDVARAALAPTPINLAIAKAEAVDFALDVNPLTSWSELNFHIRSLVKARNWGMNIKTENKIKWDLSTSKIVKSKSIKQIEGTNEILKGRISKLSESLANNPYEFRVTSNDGKFDMVKYFSGKSLVSKVVDNKAPTKNYDMLIGLPNNPIATRIKVRNGKRITKEKVKVDPYQVSKHLHRIDEGTSFLRKRQESSKYKGDTHTYSTIDPQRLMEILTVPVGNKWVQFRIPTEYKTIQVNKLDPSLVETFDTKPNWEVMQRVGIYPGFTLQASLANPNPLTSKLVRNKLVSSNQAGKYIPGVKETTIAGRKIVWHDPNVQRMLKIIRSNPEIKGTVIKNVNVPFKYVLSQIGKKWKNRFTLKDFKTRYKSAMDRYYRRLEKARKMANMDPTIKPMKNPNNVKVPTTRWANPREMMLLKADQGKLNYQEQSMPEDLHILGYHQHNPNIRGVDTIGVAAGMTPIGKLDTASHEGYGHGSLIKGLRLAALGNQQRFENYMKKRDDLYWTRPWDYRAEETFAELMGALQPNIRVKKKNYDALMDIRKGLAKAEREQARNIPIMSSIMKEPGNLIQGGVPITTSVNLDMLPQTSKAGGNSLFSGIMSKWKEYMIEGMTPNAAFVAAVDRVSGRFHESPTMRNQFLNQYIHYADSPLTFGTKGLTKKDLVPRSRAKRLVDWASWRIKADIKAPRHYLKYYKVATRQHRIKKEMSLTKQRMNFILDDSITQGSTPGHERLWHQLHKQFMNLEETSKKLEPKKKKLYEILKKNNPDIAKQIDPKGEFNLDRVAFQQQPMANTANIIQPLPETSSHLAQDPRTIVGNEQQVQIQPLLQNLQPSELHVPRQQLKIRPRVLKGWKHGTIGKMLPMTQQGNNLKALLQAQSQINTNANVESQINALINALANAQANIAVNTATNANTQQQANVNTNWNQQANVNTNVNTNFNFRKGPRKQKKNMKKWDPKLGKGPYRVRDPWSFWSGKSQYSDKGNMMMMKRYGTWYV